MANNADLNNVNVLNIDLMKLKMLILFFIVCYSTNSSGQGGTWTWIHGPSTVSYVGNYGVLGVPNSNNAPSCRRSAAYWTDTNGVFWMFGGYGYRPTNPAIYRNDMWSYDVQNNTWTWEHGPTGGLGQANGVYGSKGVSAPSNLPPGRDDAFEWIGDDGFLYIYGGHNGTAAIIGMDDFWRFNTTTKEWTWLGGSNTPNIGINPVYGTKGVASPTNHPGDRRFGSNWTSPGKLWLQGGFTYNDLWSYDISSGMWTWEAGSNVQFPPPSYGTKGVTLPSNQPPLGISSSRWQHDDKFYLSTVSNDRLNCLWEFDIISKNWTWIGGNHNSGDIGTPNPVPCEGKSNNTLAGRYGGMTVQNSALNNSDCQTLWTFGGIAEDGTTRKRYNDVWVYQPKNDTWTLVWGKNQHNTSVGNFGTKGIADANNEITPRSVGAIWQDKNNDIYIFGGAVGASHSVMADLWRFTPDPNCLGLGQDAPKVTLPNDTLICEGEQLVIPLLKNLQITITPAENTTYNNTTGELVFAPKENTNYQITISAPANSSCPFADIILKIQIDVKEKPVANFTLSTESLPSNNTKISSDNLSIGADSYNWIYENSIFSNNTNFEKTLSEIGQHCFLLQAINNCGTDNTTRCITTFPNLYIPNTFSPNSDGNNDVFRIVGGEGLDLKHLRIFNRWGQKVFDTNDINNGWNGKLKGVDCEIGTYFYTIEINNKNYRGDITLIR